MFLTRRSFMKMIGVCTAALLAGTAKSHDQVLLNFVPFFSQEDWRAPSANDCGESCWMMMLLWKAEVDGGDLPTLPTVDDLSAMWGKPVGEVAWAEAHMLPSIRRMGFTAEYSDDATNVWYMEQLCRGYPCIALVTYSGFYPENRAQEGIEGHYVVLVGYDDNGFIIHDPAWLDEYEGAYRHITFDEWWVSSQGVGFAITGFMEQ